MHSKDHCTKFLTFVHTFFVKSSLLTYSLSKCTSNVYFMLLLFQILDGVSLVNLEITANGEGSVEGTLLEQLDHCCTAFSK